MDGTMSLLMNEAEIAVLKYYQYYSRKQNVHMYINRISFIRFTLLNIATRWLLLVNEINQYVHEKSNDNENLLSSHRLC